MITKEEMVSNYPYTATRELVMNACMHRDLQSNGNPPADFNVNLITAFKVDVKIVPQKSSFHTTTTNVVDDVVKDVVNGVVKVDISQLTDRQINILEFMVQYPTITAKEMSQRLSLASRTIQRDIAILTKLGRVVREGGRYDGTWRVITKPKELTHEI